MSNLVLPCSFPDYVICPHCGEPEVEVWCYAATVRCHDCGQEFSHTRPAGCGDQCDPTERAAQHAQGMPQFQ